MNTPSNHRRYVARSTLRRLLGIATVFLASTVHADGYRQSSASVPTIYTQECAACHTAYPAGMLPPDSWQRIMRGLDDHYGTDASLDADSVRQISAWLTTHAATRGRGSESPPDDRITRSAWFVHEHDDVHPEVWKLPSVKSAANCAACHTRADQGDFDEDNISMPADMDSRLRRFWHD